MELKRLSRWVVVMILGALMLPAFAGMHGVAHAAAPAQGSGVLYESAPDEVALYLSDLAFVRDTVRLPADQPARVLLPPGAYSDTLRLTENGQRVPRYRVTPLGTEAGSGGLLAGGAERLVLSWDALPVDDDALMREITLEYLLPGATWQPSYDMDILAQDRVDLAFFAEITNRRLALDNATVYLVAGRVDLAQQVDQFSQVTMNQYAVGYSEDVVTLPALGVGAVNLQHVYRLEGVTAAPGDTLFASLVTEEMEARRLLVWNASTDPQVDVIYKVRNSSEQPLAEGIVRSYQDGLFMGSDFVETTPVGGEGSITVGGLPDVRVRRSASSEYAGTTLDYYSHTVTLEISHLGTDPLALSVLDRYPDEAYTFTYSQEPQRQPDNLLRWELELQPGDSVTIEYTFRTEY